MYIDLVVKTILGIEYLINVHYYKIIIPAGETATTLLIGLLVAISLLIVSLSLDIWSSSNSSINFFFKSTFLIHGGDQT